MLADFLDMEGYDVSTAEDGDRARSTSSPTRDYDLVISDLKMPKMGGIALLDEIGKQAPRRSR
jgi:DNA-binding response OmpR family regulator